MHPADEAQERVLADHRETVAAVLAAADEAASGIDEPESRQVVTTALETAIDDELRSALVDLLRDAVDATSRDLLAEPVPAPPYVVVAARGPLVRATLADGRLVVLLRVFRRDGDGYVRVDADPGEAVETRFRRSP